jgi:hypothetical protein
MSRPASRVAVYGLLTLAALLAWLRSSLPVGPPRRASQELASTLDGVQFWDRHSHVYYFSGQAETLYYLAILACLFLAGSIALWSAYRGRRRVSS